MKHPAPMAATPGSLSLPTDARHPLTMYTDTPPNTSAHAATHTFLADTHPLLPTITCPTQLAALSLPQLNQLAQELRDTIISSVAETGGHLSPSLGVVELTLAMLTTFNPAIDKIVWDVGHQAYAYKLLTGRADKFHTLRQHGGISGFPHREESPYDHFGVGHSSTSISAALGMAVARDLAKQDHNIVSVIGDGALTAGMAYEALNHAGALDKRFIVILNDNEMSISKNVGALSLFMSRKMSSRWARRFEREVENILKHIPAIGDDLYEIARRSKRSFKNFFTPGMLFETMRFNYIGAVNGHNIEELQQVLKLASTVDKPVLVHVLTKKGKGYAPAENNPTLFHGVGKFTPSTGKLAPSSPKITYTKAFSDALCTLANKDRRIIAITAAMPEGTGLTAFADKFPDRFFDVGICEQHAVTFAAGLATQGLRPVVAVYSTFMQRAYDQIVHDVCVQNLPVTLCLDRAGIVGEDGATHQGAFDIAYLRHIPNMTIFAPKDEAELQRGLATAMQHDGPFAMRYPRGYGFGVPLPQAITPLAIGEGEYLMHGTCNLAIIALGNCAIPALRAAENVEEQTGIRCTVYSARWVKPLPEDDLAAIAATHDTLLFVEEHSLAGGFSSAVLEMLVSIEQELSQRIIRLGLPDTFIEHGDSNVLRQRLGIDTESLTQTILEAIDTPVFSD